MEKQQNERSVLNSFITGHPAAIYQRLAPHLERKDTFVVTPSMVQHCEVGQSVLLVGMLDSVKRRIIVRENKNQGKPYLVLNISDNTESILTNIWHPMCDEIEKYLVPGEVGMFECITQKDKFKEGFMSLRIKSAIMLSYGVPIQGIFCSNGHDPHDVVSKIGGIVNDVYNVGGRTYATIRGKITVMPNILESVVAEYEDVKFMLSMDMTDSEGR
jgi:hypothetical protein